MKKSLFAYLLLISIFTQVALGQVSLKIKEKYTAHNKGKLFISWGGNRGIFSKSDITFKGNDYNFTLENVIAHDKPKGFTIDYINPARMTIPQTNFKMGFFINDHYSVAIGLDHMKYVMDQYKAVNLNGYYQNVGTYGEVLPNNQVLLTPEFLQFEHTDGLNYINFEFARHDDISKLFKITNTDNIQVNLIEGIGSGVLYPKTNTTLLGKERHDDFHFSGFGISLKSGLNLTFYKYFYIQGELKGGYINMQDIKTTKSFQDKASQEFYFLEKIISVGGIIKV